MTRVFFVGAPYWCDYLARQLSTAASPRFFALNLRHFRDLFLLLSHSDSTLAIVGLGSHPTIKRLFVWALSLIFLIRGHGRNRLLFYWIGSDVCSLDENAAAPLYVSACRWLGVRHICGAPWFVEELNRHKVKATPALFPYDTALAGQLARPPLDRSPLRVCTYLTKSGWDHLYGDRIMQAAALTPDVRWTVIGMTQEDIPSRGQVPANVSFLGWLKEPLRAQAAAHVFVRLARHDAFSGTVRDAIALNRIVLYSLPVSGAIQINDPDGLAAQIRAVADAPSRSPFLSANQHTGYAAPPFRAQVEQLRAILLGELQC